MSRSLVLYVFMHKDLSEHDSKALFESHFSWLADEFEEISGKPFALFMIQPSDAPGLSDHAYKIGTPEQALFDWREKIDEHKDLRVSDYYDDHTRKFLLLTRDDPSEGVAGIASQTGYCAISSINGDQTPAHEVGHMFGAEHEDFEVYYNGWWDETIMASGTVASVFRGNAKRFSDKNRERIRNYLKEHD